MKKLLTAVSAAVLAFTLAGCGGKSGNSQTASGSSGDQIIAQRKADAKKNGKSQQVVMAWMNWAGSPKGIERINKDLSTYTEEKLGLDVELQVFDVASYSQGLTLMLSSGEQVDVFNAITAGYMPCVTKNYCYDLEENDLIQKYGTGITSALDKSYVDACRVNGKLYGLPQQRDMAIGTFGFAIGQKYLDGIGFDYNSLFTAGNKEYISTDLNTISGIFAKLHAKYPDIYVFSPQDATLAQGLVYDNIGGDNYGVLLDPANSLKVEDLFSSKMYYDLCKTMYDWNEAGYISKDALTDGTAATLQVKAGSSMCYATATKPGIRQQESNLCGQPMIIFQTGPDFLKSGTPSAMPWCINSGTADPVAAMQFLNLCYSDPVVSNLLCWGEENKEYKVLADGHIDFADGVNAQTSEYYNNVNWELPNQFIAHVWNGDDLDIWQRMDKFNRESLKSKAMGFTFDNSSVANEYTALTNVYNEYGKQLLYGFSDPDKGIPAMVEKLNAAGLQKYIQVKQDAITKWAAATGISQ